MKPGRGIFCPFRVNLRIFSGPLPRLTLPPCPPALALSLSVLQTTSCFCTLDPLAYTCLLPSSLSRIFASFAFSMSRSFPSFILVFPLHLSYPSTSTSVPPLSYLVSFRPLKRESSAITDNSMTTIRRVTLLSRRTLRLNFNRSARCSLLCKIADCDKIYKAMMRSLRYPITIH